MKTFRVTIRFESYAATPLHSDTLFGHLCWIYRYAKGEEALLETLLKDYDKAPSLLVSDGLPSHYLPCPCLPPASQKQGFSLFEEFFPEKKKGDFTRFLALMKRIRKTPFIEAKEMEEIRDNLSPEEVARVLLGSEIKTTGEIKTGEVGDDQILIPHNTINRLTGSVERLGGGFFHSEERMIRNHLYDIHVKTSLGWAESEISEIFSLLGRWGYGKDRSTGKGQFIVESVTQEDLPEEGDAVMALSYFVPDDSLSDGFYELSTKYGKLGGHYSQGRVAFPKTPLLLLKPGAVFRVKDRRDFYGQSVGPIHPALQDVRHQTYLFPYFVKMGETGNEQ